MKGVLSVFVPGSTSSYLRAKDVINQQDPDVSQFPRSHDTGFTNTSITKLQCSHLENTERHATTGVYLTTGHHIPCIQCLYWRRKNLESHVSFCVCHTPPLDTATEPFLNEINPVLVFSSRSSYFYVSPPSKATAQRWPGPHLSWGFYITYNDTSQTEGPLWTSDRPRRVRLMFIPPLLAWYHLTRTKRFYRNLYFPR